MTPVPDHRPTPRHAEPPPQDAGSPPMFLLDDPDLAAVVPVELAAPASPTAPVGDSRDRVTCPECGSTQDVQLNRRDADDFCRRCDFPLFWVPARVARERELAAQTESLRRLPGTAGRTTLASAACPHCAERNSFSADVCVRCGRSMHPDVPPPPPPPPAAYVPPPPPPEPVVVDPGPPWWLWALLGTSVALVLLVLVLFLTGVWG